MPASDVHANRLTRLAAARLYLVCDSAPGGRKLSELLEAAIAGGVDVVQLRDKTLDETELLPVARRARTLCEGLGALFVVNDRPLLALESGADGVHVGQDDMPVAEVRELVGPDMLIGLSTHAPSEIDAAVAAGVMAGGSATGETPGLGGDPRLGESPGLSGDLGLGGDPRLGEGPEVGGGPGPGSPDYIGVGPVHATPTKLGRPAVGLELVRYAAAHAAMPFFAIGGLHAENIDAAIAAGATRVCVLRAIADAEDPEQAARALRERL